ncbi:MAG: peptidoglycan-binding domain-containing protein [Candidatus Staskawiczbacteria bacterium]|jgi:TolA-binding protein
MKKLLLVVSLCLLLAPAFTFASIDNNLYYGLQKNSDVKQLQEFLIDKGFLTGSSTGNFFSLTLKAVKAYQASVGINSTGYVGTLTRTAINSDLATQLSASNAESTTETGTTPPTPTPPATTNDVISNLQAQIALLTQQLTAMQAQQTTVQQLQQTVQQQSQTIQQIQQNTQQIAQNTQQVAQNTCTPNWQCGSWATCSNSTQTRTCTDSNNCGTTTGKPSLTQSCTMPVIVCNPNWQCSGFGACTNNQQTQTCNDSNNCGTTANEPALSQNCVGDSKLITISQNNGFFPQPISPNTKNVKIGSYVIQNAIGFESVRLDNLYITVIDNSQSGTSNLSNLTLKSSDDNLNDANYVKPVIQIDSNNQVNPSSSFSNVSPQFTRLLGNGQPLIIDIYADVGSDTTGTIQTELNFWAVAQQYFAIQPNNVATGQTITIGQ